MQDRFFVNIGIGEYLGVRFFGASIMVAIIKKKVSDFKIIGDYVLLQYNESGNLGDFTIRIPTFSA